MTFINVKKVCFASYASLLQRLLTMIQHVDQLCAGMVSSVVDSFYVESCMAEQESVHS